MALTADQMIQELKTFFTTPGLWCQGSTARDASGLPISPLNVDAVQWDIYGRLIYLSFTENTDFSALQEAHRKIQAALPPGTKSTDIEKYNDEFLDETALLSFLDDVIATL